MRRELVLDTLEVLAWGLAYVFLMLAGFWLMG